MELEQFDLLAKADKEHAVSTHGMFLKNVNIGHLTCDMYQLFDFYVGLYHELYTSSNSGIVARAALDQLPPLNSLSKALEQ